MPDKPTSAPHVFGVRHLSPMGAWQLRTFLDRVRPELILIEGLADATHLIPDIVRPETTPPIAILAYTEEQPVRTLVYPFARYSPEYQALIWAHENGVEARFFDLPSDVFLALQEGESPPEEEPAEDRLNVYERFASDHGEPNYDTFWERHFEHNPASDAYRLAAFELGAGLRELDQDRPFWRAENLVREAFMRQQLLDAVEVERVAPEKIAAVVGAFHAPVMRLDLPGLTDEQLGKLERRASKLTLMPYSYFKLSSQSGYGAGNHAPAYFELLWDCLESGRLADLSTQYLARVARRLRESGTMRSAAEVIEGVHLANALARFKDANAPVLADLRDAATTLIGHGERSVVAEAMAQVEVGTAVGRLPKGVSQTSIQDDFNRELSRLKLGKYKESSVLEDLKLDLRENRRVQGEQSAFLDLNRSGFLHRLRVLEIGFGKLVPARQDSATWAEHWQVRWTPEAEINLVEAVLLGETVELAAAYKFKDTLEKATSIADAARVVRDACECSMMQSMELARGTVQRLAAEGADFVSVAMAANQLGMTARYGDVRRFDPAPLLPLIEELFVQGALALVPAANCDADAAKKAMTAIEALNKVSLEYHDRVEEELWIRELTELSSRDDLSPILSGYACAILLERGLISTDDIAREVSRRLSPGIEADLGAGWFEGLAKRNRFALLQRITLWEQLAGYVESLDDEQFQRALVFLRRAFGDFGPQDKRRISENLGEIWGAGADAASEMLSQPLSESEEKELEDLNDFDFDDL